MNRVWIVVTVLMLAALNAGCNTIAGAGKDMERGGEKIQEQAR
jgi:predicted small secreted protein